MNEDRAFDPYKEKYAHVKAGNKVIALTEYGPVVDTIKIVDISISPVCAMVHFDNFKETWAHRHQVYEWTQEREDQAKKQCGGIHKFV